MAVVEELIALLGFRLTGTDQLAKFNNGIQTAKKGLTGMQSVMAGFAGGIAAGFAIEGIRQVGRGLMALPKGAVEVGATFEKLQTTLETIEGSSAKAKASMDWVTEFAVKTPYEVEEVANSFVKLKAYGLDPLDGSLESLGNAASAMGKPLNAAIEAMADATTGENERLKEFGITSKKAGDNITYTWQENGKKMTKTVRKDAKEISDALRGIFDSRFKGAMDKQSRTWNGMMSNMSDAWQGFQRKIADAGWFKHMSDRLRGVLARINELAKNGTLDRWAKNISDGMIATAEVLSDVGGAFIRIGGGIKQFADYVVGSEHSVKTLLITLGLIAAAFFPWTAAIAVGIAALDDLIAYINGEGSAIGFFIDNVAKGWNRAVSAVEGFRSSCQAAVQSVLDYINGLASDILSAFTNINLAEAGKAMLASLLSGIVAGAQAVLDYVGGLATKIGSAFSGIKVDASGALGANAGPPVGSSNGAGRTGPAPSAGQSSPYAPALKKGASLDSGKKFASFDAALDRTNLRSGVPSIRGNNTVATDNSTTTIQVNVQGTKATPNEIAGAIKTAQAGRGRMKDIYFTASNPQTA